MGGEVTGSAVDASQATAGSVGARSAGPSGATHGATERRMSDWLAVRLDGRWRQAEVVLYVLAAIAAWIVRFVQDDAFITYRYARNLARGEGLVFNPGEEVEGYTNFLWTVMHALPERFGWSTPVFSQVVGIALMVATVAVTLRFARRLFGSEAFAFLVALALLANMTFLTYATGGLETMQQTLLVISVAALLLPAPGTFGTLGGDDGSAAWRTRRIAAGLVAGVAVLTRMDSAVLITTWVVVHLLGQWRKAPEKSGRLRGVGVSALQIGLPAAALIVPWLAWKLAYYGNLLPNTFYAKSAGNPVIPPLYGIFYLVSFFLSYGAFLLIGRFLRRRSELFAVPGVAQALAVVPVWFLYICAVGGDFMEFRFMVPVMPLLAMVSAFLLDRFVNVRTQFALVAVLLLFSVAHRPAPTIIPYPVLTFTELNHWPNDATTTWKGKGELLAREFPGGPDVPGQPILAVAPLGVLPYYADLPTIDMLGLTDPYIARNGHPIEPYYPGHVRMSPVDYLVERGANLVIGQPGATAPEPGRSAYRLSELTFVYPSADLRDLPEDTRVIEVPQIDGQVWLIIYLAPNELVDEAIERNGWATYPVDPTCAAEDLDVVDPEAPLAGVANGLARLISERTCPEL
jgi:arabinofuranosyltransferase